MSSAGAPTPALRHGHADLDEVRLHYVEAGEGPLVVLLHGYPELWLSWRFQIPLLAAAGFRVVAPDLRGHGTSERPDGRESYDPLRLAGDVAQLIRERGAQRAMVAGHDWGGAIAYLLAMHHPEVVERLVILNAPHARRILRAMRDPRQLVRSWYFFAFQLPWLPERLIAAGGFWHRRRNFARDARPGAFTAGDLAAYREAWSQPGAVRSSIGPYRMMFRRSPAEAQRLIRPIHAPTLIVWGERDRHLRPDLAEPEARDVPGLQRVVRLPGASHWVQHDEPKVVADLLAEFFSPASRPPA